jgi:ketopantoate reductase
MARDVAAGKRTGFYDALCGAVVRAGRGTGVPTPTAAELCWL